MSFNTEPLESMCELIVDCPHSTPEWTDSGIIVLRNQNIKNGNLDLTSPSYTTQKDYEGRIKRATPIAGDIVLTREAPMGEVCRIPKGIKCCLGQRQVLLRPKKEVDGDYLFWALQSRYVQNQIAWSEGTGSTVSNLRIPLIKSLKIPRFHNSEKDIGKVLNGLWKKIRLNTQTNQTLESIAQAIFKSWFVDFEPVKAKMAAKERWYAMQPASESASPVCYAGEAALPDLETYTNLAAMCAISGKSETELAQLQQQNPDHYQQLAETAALFPSAMVDSELGEIPEGWTVKTIGNVIERLSVGKKFDQKTASAVGTVPILDQGKSGIIGYHNEEPGVRATLEKPVIVFANHTCYMRLITFDFSAIQNVLPFIGNEVDTSWTYFATKDKITFSEYKGHWPDFVITEIIVSDPELTKYFGKIINPLIAKSKSAENESKDLAQLRDSLLPKLLSGEIDLTKIENEVT